MFHFYSNCSHKNLFFFFLLSHKYEKLQVYHTLFLLLQLNTDQMCSPYHIKLTCENEEGSECK